MKTLLTPIICILLLCLFLVGCAGQADFSMQDLRKGTNGIVLKFLDDQPPTTIIENDRFVMTLNLQNDGAATAKNTILNLGVPSEYINADLNSATMNGDPTTLQFDLEGKSMKNPNGGLSILMIPATALPITTSKKQQVTIAGQICYDYETVAEANICANYDPSYQLKVFPCKPKAISLSSQGAPVAITKIDVKPKYTPEGRLATSLTITLQNKGTGRVIEAGQSAAVCSSRGDLTKVWDRVIVTAVMAGKKINCKKDYVTLENNKAEITCEGTVENVQGPYVAPLQVYLDYGYTQTLSKQFYIERIK